MRTGPRPHALLCGLAAALAFAGAAPAAQSARTARVVVTDSSIAPQEAKIGIGDSVTWANPGTHAYRIASDTGAWPAFGVPPGGEHTVPFPKAGRFPYTVDGARHAVVVVSTGRAGSSDLPLMPGERRVRYDVTVTVTSRYHEVWEHPVAGTGVVDTQENSTARWADVGFRIISNLVVPTSPGGSPGTIQAWATFSAHSPPRIYQPENCQGELAVQTYDSRLAVGAIGRSTINFIGQADDAGMAFFLALTDKIKSRCRVHPEIVNSGLSMSFTLPDKIEFTNSGALSVVWSASASGTVPFPLDQILAGRSFVIETGTQTKGSSPKDSSEISSTEQMAIRIEFAAR